MQKENTLHLCALNTNLQHNVSHPPPSFLSMHAHIFLNYHSTLLQLLQQMQSVPCESERGSAAALTASITLNKPPPDGAGTGGASGGASGASTQQAECLDALTRSSSIHMKILCLPLGAIQGKSSSASNGEEVSGWGKTSSSRDGGAESGSQTRACGAAGARHTPVAERSGQHPLDVCQPRPADV